MNSLPSIPLATPYPWPEEEEEDDGGNTSEQDAPTPSPHTTVAAATSTPVAPGWAHLETQLMRKSKQKHDDNNNSDGLLSDAAKRTLMQLLREQKVQLQGHSERSSSSTMTMHQHHPNNNHKPKSPVTTVIDNTMSDETVLHLAAHGQISFLGSILSVIDQYPLGSVSSKHIIKECALTVNPSRTPGLLDAREMVLAALHFLSQTYQPSRSNGDDDDDDDDDTARMISLPLIRPLSITGDLERRSYEKAGGPGAWKLDDRMLTQVATLEEHFYSSETDFRWISRDKFLPPAFFFRHDVQQACYKQTNMLAAPDLDDFYLKGTVPRQLQLQQQQQSVKGAGRTAASKPPTKKQSSTSGTGSSKKQAAAASKTKKPKSPAKTTPLKTKKAKTTTTGDAVQAEALRIHDETANSNHKQPAPPASSTEEEEDDDNNDDVDEEEDHF